MLEAMIEKKHNKTILIVDDTPDNITLLNSVLKDLYNTKIAVNGEIALKIASIKPQPDLILLDIMMPGMDGYEVCQRLKSDTETKDIPIIFLTAKIQVEYEEKGFDVGAVDYITKPISIPTLKARVSTHLFLKEAADQLKNQNQVLEIKVKERTKDLQISQDISILAMATLAEIRDNETGNHIRRTQNYIRFLAQEIQKIAEYQDYLTDENIDLLYKSAPLHDIGKVGIPDSILLKPGKLDADEFHIMKKHAEYGENAIIEAETLLGNKETSYLFFAREIAGYHHEKWDGSGYPRGLSGEDIPLSARLMALADVYDALISRRVYKPAFSHEQAVEIILEGKGTHFDPNITSVFETVHESFRSIAKDFSDTCDFIEE